MQEMVLAMLGVGLVPADTPVIRADDPGVTRGDGCFEGIRVVTDSDGVTRPAKLDRHLARMTRSAAALEIPFDEPAWRDLVALACAAWTEPARGDAAMKLVLTRAGAGFVTITPLMPDYPRQRREGIRVITLSRGLANNAFDDAPWLLGGVKTLSYAVNMAAQREAERSGAEEAIFVSADGYVLEAPTGTVVWANGRTFATTPLEGTGILGGTTQQLLFDEAERAGWRVRAQLATVDELHAAEALWIVSSVRGPVEVIELDGKARRPVPDLTAEIKTLAGF